ncbi:EF-P lysine aminoacylase EpmA [Lichenicoccus sp.]|uniref:EF-P lysine aminoacylase EpmA n=1 Tax=Lichenicoccus sp. TaxID=2781899 RepID=UPI003D117682
MSPQPPAPVPQASVADRLPLLRRRAMLVRGVRGFFEARGYLEVETPFAVRTPGEEVHLHPFATKCLAPDGTSERLFLHTSPEFAMKRLVAATAQPVFQLARVWRNGEAGPLHAAEFTMLEWYRPGAGLAGLMDETEALLRALLPPMVERDGARCRIDAPFERLTLQEAFARHTGADLLATQEDAPALARQAGVRLRDGEGLRDREGRGETWEDLFFRLLLSHVEPQIGRQRPTFLTHWPAAQAALARRDPDDPRVALRFELYACGLELANAFDELTDPAEQRARFLHDRARRAALPPPVPGWTVGEWPMDEALLAALQQMPPCSGIALGFDRLVMLATGAARINDILWLGGAR